MNSGFMAKSFHWQILISSFVDSHYLEVSVRYRAHDRDRLTKTQIHKTSMGSPATRQKLLIVGRVRDPCPWGWVLKNPDCGHFLRVNPTLPLLCFFHAQSKVQITSRLWLYLTVQCGGTAEFNSKMLLIHFEKLQSDAFLASFNERNSSVCL